MTMISTQPPTDRDIDRIATQVIKNSLLLSVHLGIEASVWLELKEDCHKIVDINRSILYKWRNEHPGKAKCRELAQALCNVDMKASLTTPLCLYWAYSKPDNLVAMYLCTRGVDLEFTYDFSVIL
jgi:hypothetical protein